MEIWTPYEVLLALSFMDIAAGHFTEHFKKFVRNVRDESTLRRLSRDDIVGGSFGGLLPSEHSFNHRAIVLVHGLTGRASNLLRIRDFFASKGYNSGELFATTYGNASAVSFYDTFVACDFFKQVRDLIELVAEYTSNKVDLMGYSLGALVGRKAILGGRCFDRDENLGGPLTRKVETFVSLGGVCYGLQNCPPTANVCNNVSSMNCHSQVLVDLNGQSARFEGQSSFAIYSNEDTVLGTECCGHHCGMLAHANETFEVKGDHGQVMHGTVQKQYELLSATPFTLSVTYVPEDITSNVFLPFTFVVFMISLLYVCFRRLLLRKFYQAGKR